jgi:hypothetical protein
MTDTLARSPLWPADNPAAIAHINLLQGIITRLANNSGSCKTWCLTLVGALLSLAGATHVPALITFALVPVVIFGFLDTMYLAQEKAYRNLYKRVMTSIQGQTYALKDAFDAKASVGFNDFLNALRSWSVFPVYLGLIIVYFVSVKQGWLALLTAAAK